MKNKLRLLRRGDVIVIAGALVCAITSFLFFSATGNDGAGAGFDASAAVVRADGKVWREIPLSADSTTVFTEGGRDNVITVENGAVRMESANCPDNLCVKQGPAEYGGPPIVCLPNRISIRISKETANNGE